MKLSKIACICLLGLYSTSPLQAENKTSLGEVTITGTKLSKSLQETIEGVQVFDDVAILNSAKMDDLTDILEQTSSVSRYGDSDLIIRGIDETGFAGDSIGPRTIDVNIDGVSQSRNASRNGGVSTWDLEQVEVLKGPQSTSQGRNSLAGAIILKTKNPEFEANGAAKVDYGTKNTSRLSVMQTGPITDNLAARISLERSATDGFITNDEIKDDKFNKSESLNVRGKLLYEYDNGGDLLLTLNRVKTESDGTWSVSNGTHNQTNVSSAFERKSEYNRDGYRNTDANSYSLEINQPLNPNWSFKSVTTYHDTDYTIDSNNGELGNIQYQLTEQNIKDLTQEFRFTYQKDKLNALFGVYLADGSANNSSELYDRLAFPGVYFNGVTNESEDYINTALFTNVDYEFTDQLTLIAGLRIDRDDRISKGSAVYTNNQGIPALNAQLAAASYQNLEEENTTTNVLPKLGLNYKWNDNINTGILFSQGYRPGGISTAGSESYDAEFTDNLELSFRSKWLENTLTINANVFYTKYQDMHVSERNNNGDTIITNAGKASMKGIELDTKYLVNDKLDIYGNIGYIRTKFVDYNNFNGNEFPNTPNFTANIGSTYRHANGYFVGGNVTYNDKSFSDTANTTVTKSYTLTNVKVGYEENNWSAYLYSNNLFDKQYLTNNSTDTSSAIGDPRIVGITLSYNW